MIELATLKSVVDLFKELISIRDNRREDKQKTFDRVCKPLYEQLEPIAQEYYSIVHECSVALNDVNPDYKAVVNRARARRATMVLARNAVLGAGLPYLKESIEQSRPEFDSLMHSFVTSIILYFFYESALMLGPYKNHELPTTFSWQMFKPIPTRSTLTHLLRRVAEMAGDSPCDTKEALLAEISVSLQYLEWDWTTVSKQYSELRWYCYNHKFIF